MASAWQGVSVGSGTLLTATPTWTRLDTGISGLACNGVSIRRGRRSTWERTETGTCTVSFTDRAGYLDPTGASSLISKPFAVAIRNPVTDEWFPLFRGSVDDVGVTMNRSQRHLDVVVQAVDLFDYFANFELLPGLAGMTNAAVNAAGYVVYAPLGYDNRINAILGDAHVPSAFRAVFSGNIICTESRYSAGDRVMQALEEAVDAEFPTIANHYVDKQGKYQAHGRYARFYPDTVNADAPNWDFNRWKVGDNVAAAADATRARMQEPYTFSESRADIRNAALCYPVDFWDIDNLQAYVYEDAASQTAHGTRTWTAPNLAIESETSVGLTAEDNCYAVSEYVVTNYKDPVPRIPQVTVATVRPESVEYGPAAWAYMCGADISDIVNVQIGHPGGGGFNADHFIEGISIDIEPGPGSLDNSFPLITHTVDLSSAAHWANLPDVFGTYPPA